MRLLLVILLSIFGVSLQSEINKSELNLPEFMVSLKPTPELVKDCALHYNIQHVDIVVAQSILETGHYTSKHCVNNNNLFGLYDSKNKRYYKFDTWQESVLAYKNKVQYKYKGGCYYKFLDTLGYASDPNYLDKVKVITEKYL